jgi:hypothetical protein
MVDKYLAIESLEKSDKVPGVIGLGSQQRQDKQSFQGYDY